MASTAGCATDKKPEPEPPLITHPESLRPRIIALLSGSTPKPEQWKGLGAEALTVLRQIASDAAEEPTRRARAVASMAYLDDPQSADAIASFATDPNVLRAVRCAAVRALASRDGTGSVTRLVPLLTDPDAEVRGAVAQALGEAGGADARAALLARLDAETEAAVREQIQRSLAKIAN